MAKGKEMIGRRSREGVSGCSSRRDNSTLRDLNTIDSMAYEDAGKISVQQN